jgi:hypothetical protein
LAIKLIVFTDTLESDSPVRMYLQLRPRRKKKKLKGFQPKNPDTIALAAHMAALHSLTLPVSQPQGGASFVAAPTDPLLKSVTLQQ